jgi:hypothetical protein
VWAVLLVAGASAAAWPQQSLNVAYVTVLDRRQAPVQGLGAADISIIENGETREVVEAVPAADPLAVAVLVDTAKPRLGTFAATRDIRRAVTTLVARVQAAAPGSRIALMETGGAAVLQVDFTADRRALDDGIDRLFQSQRSSSVVLEGLQAIGKTIAEQRETRRAIVSIDFDSEDTSRIQPKEYASAVQLAGASVVAVSVRSEGNPAPGRNGVLAWTTAVTGGMRVTGIATSALEAQLETVARALTSQYRVTWVRPAGTPVGELRGSARGAAKVLVTRAVPR